MNVLARFVLTGAFALAACNDSTPSSTPPLAPPSPGMMSVYVSPSGTAIAHGDSLLFHATTNVSAITAFTWSSDHPDVASVDDTGLVKGHLAGVVNITACGKGQTICGSATLTIH